ncbi:DUF4358 domain-containing protein [Clostridium brassicae]|uniref:DUF4358 domain-containing protein n=1 Tax=Clostridium brassicae TaxID=2999072 RepID=A0ABT4D770_9CLOT|nr:DUF4358 domain-containing protein [Clostridium brassicae]MCY6958123.1 DUF4358 domain-containing protein [Clostridium brassicae]
MLNKMKKINRKLIVITGVIVFTVATFVGCSSSKSSSKSPEVSKVVEEMKESIDESDMKKGDEDKLKKLYKINPDEIEEFVMYAPSTNLKANELLVLKVKDASKVDNIKEQVSKRIEKQAASFKDYLPDEYYLIEKHVLKTKGNYILLSISKNSEKIESIFDKAFK